MKAWAAVMDPSSKSKIRFLADPHAHFTSALDLTFDSKSIFGNERSKRYALVIEDGKVKEAHVEPDNTGVDGTVLSTLPRWPQQQNADDIDAVSSADNVLKA